MLWTLELWERFGYYGLQAILAIYFARKLGFSDAEAMLIFGSFSALFVWWSTNWWLDWR